MDHVMKYLVALSLPSSGKTSWCETKKSNAGGYMIISLSKKIVLAHTEAKTQAENGNDLLRPR